MTPVEVGVIVIGLMVGFIIDMFFGRSILHGVARMFDEGGSRD